MLRPPEMTLRLCSFLKNHTVPFVCVCACVCVYIYIIYLNGAISHPDGVITSLRLVYLEACLEM